MADDNLALPPDADYRQSMIEAVGQNPDVAAKAIPIARSARIPLDMAERNMDFLQRDAEMKSVLSKQVMQKVPSIGNWLRDRENARIAWDDVDTLTKISDLTIKAPIGGVISGTGMAIGAVGTVLEGEEALYGRAGYATELGKFLRANVAKPLKEFGHGLVPEARRTTGTEVATTLGQMVPMIAAAVYTGSAAVGAAVGAGQNADSMAEQAEIEGATAREKFFSSLAAGAGTLATEYGPLKLILGKFPWMKKMLEKAPEGMQNVWAQRAADIGVAGSAEAAQELVENIMNNTIEHYVFNPDQEIMEDVYRAAQLGGYAGGVARAIVMAVGGNLRSQSDIENQKKTMAEARIAAQSKLLARSPEKFKEAVTAIRGDENYYIPVEKGVQFFQSMSDEDADKLQENFPDLKRKIADAVNTGSDIMLSQAEYLTYLAPLDTKQILAGVMRAHQEIDVLETFPELKDMIPRTGDNVGDELQARLEKEARASGRARGEAELYASAARAAYSNLVERAGQNEEFMRLVEQRLGSGLSIGERPEIRIEKGDIDRVLNLWRARVRELENKPTTRKDPKTGKEVVIRGRKAPRNIPIIKYLSTRGVAEGSELARELERIGINKKNNRALFRKEGASGPGLFGLSAPGQGRKVAFDAIPTNEMNDYLQEFGLVAPDDGTGNVDPEWIMEQLTAEAAGSGAPDVETAAEAARQEDLSRFLDFLGVDINKNTNAEIKKAIDDYNNKGLFPSDTTPAELETVAELEKELEKPPEFKPEEKPAPIEEQVKQEQEEETVAGERIDDFGEKLEGAKKDLWQSYKKSLTDELPEDLKEVTLSKHLPEPDYAALIAQGVDTKVLAAIKAMRDAIPNKPKMPYKLKRWVEQVKVIREFTSDLVTGRYDVKKVLSLMAENRVLSEMGDRIKLYADIGYPDFLKAKEYQVADGMVSMLKGVKLDKPKKMWTVMKADRWLESFDTEQEAVNYIRLRLATETPEARTTKLDIYQVSATGEIIIGKKVGSGKYLDLKGGFTKVSEARAYLKDNEKALLLLLEKRKEIRPERRSVNDPRKGTDYRKGENLTPEKFANEFGFRGVQFGNYVEQGRRVKDLNNAYDALLDLSNLIGIPSRAVSLNGEIGLAFGARGSGGKGAPAAHFEPDKLVINLTKTSGAGSLGHEWWHALDNYFARKRGDDFVTKSPRVKKLRGPDRTLLDDDSIRPEMLEAFNGIMTAIKKSGLVKRSVELDKRKTKNYWSTEEELSARAFEAYLISKAAGKDESNDYLANILSEEAHNAMNEIEKGMGLPGNEPFPYPTAEELKTIAPAFDKFFETLKTRETERGVELFQGKRGSVNFTPSGRTIIELFRDADKSTILHEMGHIFLDVLRGGSTIAEAPEGVVADYGKVKKWWIDNYKAIAAEAKDYNPYQVLTNRSGYYSVVFAGKEAGVFNTKKEAKARADELHAGLVKELETRGGEDYVKKFLEGNQSDPDETDQMILTAMDEQFARGFEAYLFEGKAPSVGMVGMFRKFSTWLVKIYQSIRNLRVSINDDLRGVFDRMLASDAAIEEVRSLKVSRLDPNVLEMMNKNQQEAYKRQQAEVFEAARDRTIRRALRDADREVKQWWKDETAAIERELTEKYENDPIYIAIRFLRTGEGIDGLEPLKINRDNFATQYPAAMAKFPSGVFSKTGVDVDVVATSLGFPDVDSFVSALSGVPELDARVAKEARAEMNSRHGDVFLDGRLEEVAVGNVLSHEAADLIEMEMKAAGKKLGAEFPANRDFKAAAERSLATMTVKDARKPNRFLLSTIRMAKNGATALAKKNYEEYAAAKRKELFSINMYRQSRDFVEFHGKVDDYYAKMMRRPPARTRPSIEPEYHRMIWRVLANFMPSREPAITAEHLQMWVNEQMSSEFDSPVYMSPDAVQGMKKANFQTMSVAEFEAVHALVKNLEAKGRADQTIMIEGKRRERGELIAQMIEQLDKNLPDRSTDRQSEARPLEGYLSIQTAAGTYFEIADGGDQVGIFDMALKKPIDDGQSREAARNTEAAEAIAKIFNDHYSKKELMDMTGDPMNMTLYKKTQVNGVWMSKMERLAGLLNMGNAGNEEAFLEGQRWKLPEQREAFLATFDERDFKWAQAVGDYLETYWPKIAELEMRRYGHPPEKVEVRPLETPFGEFRGWYYPIAGDPSKSVRVREFQLQNEMKGFVGYASTATSRSHTIERVGVNPFDPMPLRLDFSVLTKHVSRVIHDLEMGEPIAQTAKLIRDTRFKAAFEAKFGVKAYQQVDLWLKDVAAGNIMSYDAISSTITWARRNMTVAVMGLSMTTILSQVSGVTNSVVGLARNVNTPKGRSSVIDGAKWLGIGYKRQMAEMTRGGASYRAFMDAIHQKSPFMRDRATTIMRDVREVNETWAANPVDTNKIRRAMMYPIGAMQKVAVDTATWLGAYEKYLAETNEKNPQKKEARAIRYADNIVRDYQSSGLMQDLSGILRGTTSPGVRQNALYKLYTFAFNYFNNKVNRVMVHSKLADFNTGRGRYEFARDMIFLVWMDALIADIVLNRLPSMLDDDEDKDKFTEGWGWWLLQQPASALPLVRDVASAIKMPRGGGDSLDKVIGSVGNLVTQIGQGDADKALLKSFVTAAGATTGLVPSVQLNRVIDMIDRASDGKDLEYTDFVRTRKKDEK